MGLEAEADARRRRIAALRHQRIHGTASVLPAPEVQAPAETAENGLEPLEAPSVKLSEEITVEALAKSIQDDIFARSSEAAALATLKVSLSSEKTGPLAYNKDLKQALEAELSMAEQRTNRAINDILRKRLAQEENGGR